MRTGVTLIELITVLTILGILASVAVPSIASMRDRAAVRGATSALVSALADARHLATRWNRRTAVRLDTAAARAIVHTGRDTVGLVPLGELFGVSLVVTRDSIAYYPTGLGFGAANARFIVRRGAVAETVTVSRAGRVKR